MKKTTSRPAIAPYAFVGIGAVLMLAPFYYMFVFATHYRSDIFTMPPPMWFGDAFMFNLDLLLKSLPTLWHNLYNSVYVAVISTALTLFFCSLGGYAFAMYDFRFKKLAFSIVLTSMLLPAFLGMIPTFMLMDAIGWMDKPRALYIPGAAGAFGIFLMRQYIGSSVPRELLEAARIDGCGEFRIYWNIVLPLITPALGTLGLVTFIGSWNNFLGPLIVMHSVENYTLPLALRSIQSTTNTEWGAVLVGASVAVVPLLVLFVIFSRQLIDGLAAGSVKG
ncbi:MAG: carbohydrate ABC transporter permease [Pseudomonadota bacterium]